MGDLIKTPHSEINAFIAGLDSLGVTPDDLKVFRSTKAKTWRRAIAKALMGDPMTCAALRVGDELDKLGIPPHYLDAVRKSPEGMLKLKETLLDYLATSTSIIRVNRLADPPYPDMVEMVMHPEFENTGPAEYDLVADVRPWIYSGTKDHGNYYAEAVYDYLKSNNMLGTCLGFADGLEIMKKSRVLFHELFGRRTIYLWRSVVKVYNHTHSLPRPLLMVPSVQWKDAKVMLLWQPVVDFNVLCDNDDLALCFAKLQL